MSKMKLMSLLLLISCFGLQVEAQNGWDLDCDLGRQQWLSLDFSTPQHSLGGFLILRDPVTDEKVHTPISKGEVLVTMNETFTVIKIKSLVTRTVTLQFFGDSRRQIQAQFAITSANSEKIEYTVTCQRN